MFDNKNLSLNLYAQIKHAKKKHSKDKASQNIKLAQHYINL